MRREGNVLRLHDPVQARIKEVERARSEVGDVVAAAGVLINPDGNVNIVAVNIEPETKEVFLDGLKQLIRDIDRGLL